MIYYIPDVYQLSYFRHSLILVMLISRYVNQLASKSGSMGGKDLFMVECQLINAAGMVEVVKSEFSNYNSNN